MTDAPNISQVKSFRSINIFVINHIYRKSPCRPYHLQWPGLGEPPRTRVNKPFLDYLVLIKENTSCRLLIALSPIAKHINVYGEGIRSLRAHTAGSLLLITIITNACCIITYGGLCSPVDVPLDLLFCAMSFPTNPVSVRDYVFYAVPPRPLKLCHFQHVICRLQCRRLEIE